MNRYKFFLVIFSVGIVISLILCFTFNENPKEDKEAEIKPVLTQNALPAAATRDELNEAAQYLIEYGIIDTGKYFADHYVSRIVAARIILDITGLTKAAQNSEYPHPFIDLTDKNEKTISYLYHYNIIEGASDNHFMEEEICDADTFLLSLIRALDFVGGNKSDIDIQNVRQTAIEKCLISKNYKIAENDLFSVNDAFYICYNALDADIGDSCTLLDHLHKKGVIRIGKNGDYDTAYEVFAPPITPFFEEDFNDKVMRRDGVYKNYSPYWMGSRVKGADNCITKDSRLQISGTDQNLINDQQIALQKSHMQGNESYGMTFTVNIGRMGNEGSQDRVIFRVIPRTADKEFTKYYAINYYMVLPLGDFESNLARCKWSITNTNAPSGTAPLAEAYYLLKEDVDYTARLSITNTDGGNVHIEFYIDGADRVDKQNEPLLKYTDSSEYKIMQSATGPAFGISGNKVDGWGLSSCVKFDDVKIYDTQSFSNQTEQLAAFAQTPVAINENKKNACQLRYLVNHGTVKPYKMGLDYIGNVSVKQFLASAMYLNGQYMNYGQTLDQFVDAAYNRIFKGTDAANKTDINRTVTRYEAALIIQKMMPGTDASNRYQSLYKDRLKSDYKNAVYYAVQNSYLLLDNDGCFCGDAFLTRQNLLRVLTLAVDSRLRSKNQPLQLPGIISDYAIFQRNKPIPISGKGMSGDTVTVRFNGQTKTAKVVDGRWRVELDSQPHGGPYRLTIQDSGYTRTFKQIYVGEVFVLAGQSNAEWSLLNSDDNKEALRNFNNQSRVRLYCPDHMRAATPLFNTKTGWEVARDEYSRHIFGESSAVGVFFVDKLTKINPALSNIRIGLIQITYGGASIELFMPNQVYEKYDHTQKDDEFIASGFWNGYMDFIAPYAARALIYYQGENSAHIKYHYEQLLRDYIEAIREEFCDSSLPVMLVQLTGYGENHGQENDSWPIIREIQMRVANTDDNIGLVTAIDLSDADPFDIHPTNKKPIGERLAYLAMNLIYGQEYAKQSPSMTDYALDGNVYRITVAAQELSIKQDAFGSVSFEILNAGGQWIPAQAKTQGNTVLVWDEYTAEPKGVRYAWANYPCACLFDQQGLPVLPFNTTKDLNTTAYAQGISTNSHYIKKAYHLLDDNDVIINITRNNQIRYVKVVNAYLVELNDEDILGQAAGDQIIMLKRQPDLICEAGTTDQIIKCTAHGLSQGDWIRNVKRGTLTKVLEVIDDNAIRIGALAGQTAGQTLEVYKNTGMVTAE